MWSCGPDVELNDESQRVLTSVAFALTCSLLLMLLIVLPGIYATLRAKLKRLRGLKRLMREYNKSRKPPLTTMLEARAKKPKQALIFESDGQIWMPIATQVADGWRLRRRVVLLTPSFTSDIKERTEDAQEIATKTQTSCVVGIGAD